ncbi:uncharacterized protein LOC111364804 [Spodoptera litura]|uniref:RNA-directed DNA polymerase n=1 Tax=Spodoptera litura TaxID=69820 RepID=A0A9J7EX88_SPOLT|nr:uncharacterized protein LOC111364804 [Spodoptera litura]
MRIQAYNLNMQYTPGRANVVADTLSRPVPATQTTDDDGAESACDLCSVSIDLPHRNPEELRAAQLGDPEIKKILDDFGDGDTAMRWTDRGYYLSNGVLFRFDPDGESEEPQFVVPEEMRMEVMKELHDAPTAGHLGLERTLRKVKEKFYFPHMRQFIAKYLKACDFCQKYKPTNLKPAGLLQTPVPHQRFEVLAMDLFGPLPEGDKGEKWILLIEDTASRWVELFALRDATAESCAKALIEEVFLRYGFPRRVISDNGTQFVSAVMQKAMLVLGVDQSLVPVYHPEANPAERKNWELKKHLAILVGSEHRRWPFALSMGVTCFHIVSALHLVATGGCDGSVRLWQPCGRAPFATLAAPTSPAILDLAIVAAHELIIAFCNNCTLYIWDLYEECLLQTIKIKFPFLGVLGKKVEFGPYCIHPGPVRKEKEEETDELILEEPIVMSRRASSVYQGSTGGLMLQLDMDNEWDKKGLKDEPEYKRFNRCEILVSCCDFVCTVRLTDVAGAVVPPPADTLRARRPSVWDLPDYPATSTSSTTPRLRPSLAPTPQLLSPSTAEFPLTDLDTLLENAGLQGILEKDFVLMQGLKNDLNKKLAEMEANKQVMTNAVSAGAPYLALKTYDPSLVEPVDEMLDEYRRVMKLFPSTSITGTPTGSEKSTPRRSRSHRL